MTSGSDLQVTGGELQDVLNTRGDRLPLPLGPCSALGWRKKGCAPSSLFFLPRLPTWFQVLDDHVLPLT